MCKDGEDSQIVASARPVTMFAASGSGGAQHRHNFSEKLRHLNCGGTELIGLTTFDTVVAARRSIDITLLMRV